jgi:prevent-host-death family protein
MMEPRLPRRRSGARRVPVAEARRRFSRILDDVREGEEPVIIEKSGVPVAAVVPLAVLDRDRRWAAERAERIALLERMRRPFRDVPPEEIETQVRKAIASVRAERSRRPPRR